MEPETVRPERQDIAGKPVGRFLVGAGRAFKRACPYCGMSGVFRSWFSLKERCPYCGTLYAYETGYLLGSYAVNLIVTEFLAAAIVIGLIVYSGLSVLQMQIGAIILAVGLPLLFYPTAVLLWIALDVALHPPDNQTGTHHI